MGSPCGPLAGRASPDQQANRLQCRLSLDLLPLGRILRGSGVPGSEVVKTLLRSNGFSMEKKNTSMF